MHPGQTACDETRAAFGRRSIPPDRVAARRSSLRFGRNTPGIPPSRALSAGRLAGLGAHAGSTTGCSPRRCAPLIVAFRSKYTRYSSLTRLVSRAPPQPRRSRGFHHRLFTAPLRVAHRCASVEIPLVFLPRAPCQPGPHREDWPHRENWASPLSALTLLCPPTARPGRRGASEGGALLGTSPTRRAPKPAGAGRCEFAAVRAAMPV